MKEPSKVEQMWDRVAGMVPKAAVAPWSLQPRGIQDGFIHAVNNFSATGDYSLAFMVFQNARKQGDV
jgi:hypothetical protein